MTEEHIPKEQYKTPEVISKVERNNLPNKELKVMIIKMLNKLGRRMNEYSEKFNKEFKNIKNQTEIKHIITRASLVAQWLRICLLMQGTRVRALVWEDPTCRGATGPVSHNY